MFDKTLNLSATPQKSADKIVIHYKRQVHYPCFINHIGQVRVLETLKEIAGRTPIFCSVHYKTNTYLHR